MLDLIRRIAAWTRRPFVPIVEQRPRHTPTEHPAAGQTAPPPTTVRRPRWCTELLHAEETALVRLYVTAEGERDRLKIEARWRPNAACQHWNMAEAH
ncbi:hypothetical protein AF335_03435 [Streptomyces eurocidicus]|uniref:Uncharacterized protein n=1 Tax=Streptomyces eurocidicus TaxID=66423 RepID=A0A2N8P314_STREU|nr:hypothetical protein AF335_03435 [Streptomyces eurocidicus]